VFVEELIGPLPHISGQVHHAKGAGSARLDVGEAVSVLITRPAVAIVGKDRDAAQRRIDEQFPRGDIEG